LTTLEKKYKELLFNHGLWENECDAIFEEFRKSPSATAMTDGDRDRFLDDMQDYGENATFLFGVLWLGLKNTALEWLGKNKPLHWARAMFSENPDEIIAEQKELWEKRREARETGMEEVEAPAPPPRPAVFGGINTRAPNMQQLPREKKP
jgi:hypothetical protein